MTADAMSCQKRITAKILGARADYLLAVKNNQRKLYEEVSRYFADYWERTATIAPPSTFSEQQGRAHINRDEHRRCWSFCMICLPVQ